ncbi:tautomerase family protein [Aeromonas rivipollensis]|uniref:tautomerase family protein n=1 Tax=Aeromonas rivipollensis TaxID=948519 RepID=UPI003D217547
MLFQILAGKPRSTVVKQRLYERLAERLHADLGIHPDNLMVVIQLNGCEEWSFGRGLMFRQEVAI